MIIPDFAVFKQLTSLAYKIYLATSGFVNFIDEWSQCDFHLTNFGVILEYLESTITMEKTVLFHIPKEGSHTITLL